LRGTKVRKQVRNRKSKLRDDLKYNALDDVWDGEGEFQVDNLKKDTISREEVVANRKSMLEAMEQYKKTGRMPRDKLMDIKYSQKKPDEATMTDAEKKAALLERSSAHAARRTERLRSLSVTEDERVKARSEKQIKELMEMSYTSRMQQLNAMDEEDRAIVEAHLLVCDDAGSFVEPLSPKDKSDMRERLDCLSPEAHAKLLTEQVSGPERAKVIAGIPQGDLNEVLDLMGPLNKARIVKAMSPGRKKNYLASLTPDEMREFIFVKNL